MSLIDGPVPAGNSHAHSDTAGFEVAIAASYLYKSQHITATLGSWQSHTNWPCARLNRPGPTKNWLSVAPRVFSWQQLSGLMHSSRMISMASNRFLSHLTGSYPKQNRAICSKDPLYIKDLFWRGIVNLESSKAISNSFEHRLCSSTQSGGSQSQAAATIRLLGIRGWWNRPLRKRTKTAPISGRLQKKHQYKIIEKDHRCWERTISWNRSIYYCQSCYSWYSWYSS